MTRPKCGKCGSWYLTLRHESNPSDSFTVEYAYCLLCGWRGYRPERREPVASYSYRRQVAELAYSGLIDS